MHKDYVNIPLATLRWLEQEYPEVNPGPTNSKEQIMYQAGIRSVVLRLLEMGDPKGHRYIQEV